MLVRSRIFHFETLSNDTVKVASSPFNMHMLYGPDAEIILRFVSSRQEGGDTCFCLARLSGRSEDHHRASAFPSKHSSNGWTLFSSSLLRFASNLLELDLAPINQCI